MVDERYGSFTAAWRFTRDQVPLPFDLTGGRAWFHDLHSSQVVSCGAGLDRRQCTLDIMFSGDLSEDQPAPAIIFKCVFVVMYCMSNLRKLVANFESQILTRPSSSVGPASASVIWRKQTTIRMWWCSFKRVRGKTHPRRWIGRSELWFRTCATAVQHGARSMVYQLRRHLTA